MLSLTNETKHTTTFANQVKTDSRTWDNALETWDEVQGTWDNPITTLVNETKHTTSFINETKS
jgi:hypothetical protein